MAIHEECGVFGIYDPAGGCAKTAYYGLFALQHRGQESCGIAANNNMEITCHKDMGTVEEVFSPETLDRLNGTMAIGHVRYSTAGGSLRENCQPLNMRYVKNRLALAHNGNLINAGELKKEFELSGAIFQSSSDSEIIAYAIARERLSCGSVEVAISKAMPKLRGAFSIVAMSSRKLMAVRDPWGFRPLCIGKRGEAWIFASESCAVEAVGGEFVRDVKPGEIVIIEQGRMRSIQTEPACRSSLCIFEHIYFARPDSVIDGQSVHAARLTAGRLLARKYPVEADVVIGVPDSGMDAALGYAEESGIPFGFGFSKNRYIGRTFIKPTQSEREDSVRIKLSVIGEAVRGKRVVLIDDSIVRGTTSRQIIDLIRDAGAKEIHMRVSAPPFISPCYFGTDIPDKDSLIACKYTPEEICALSGADSLGFLSLEDVEKIAPNSGLDFCDACFSCNYPLAPAK
ncbi:MAG: amidophosphoribosyltransferase [Oscillospiraceae bacterium]